MTRHPSAMVMDLSPWANGSFQGSQEWWTYILTKDERKRLDHLLGVALLDETVRRRLVSERDEKLFTSFGLSEPTKQWLRAIEAKSLSELAKAVVDGYKRTA